MKKILIPTVVVVCLLIAGAAMSMGRRGPGVDVVVSIPLLPAVVELQEEPYYYHSGYYYHYNNDRWYYAKSKRGPWADLPRDHYPNETRYKGKSWRHDRGRDNDDRGRDGQGRYDRDDRRHDDQGRYDRDNDDRGRDQGDDNRGNDNRR